MEDSDSAPMVPPRGIRDVTGSDAAEYRKIRLASEAEFPQYVGAGVEHELGLDPAALEDLLLAYPGNGHSVFAVFEDRRILGVAALSVKQSRKYAHKAFLWGMYVYPEHRKTGVSSLLMKHALALSRGRLGVSSIQLFVTTTNEKAFALYSRYGFVRYGTERKHMFSAGTFHDAHLLELELAG